MLRALLAAATALALAVVPSAATVSAPLEILAVGDSRTATGQWPAELSRLLTESVVPNTMVTQAVGGTDCYYWTSRIQGLLDQYHPSVVILACGTNDDPAATIYGESKTSWSFRYIAETAHASGAHFLPVLVQYSDPILMPTDHQWLLTNEPQTNDHLYGEMRRHWDWWPGGVADFQLIPATASYLQADPYPAAPPYQIGIHPNPRGSRYMGRLADDAGAANGWWPATTEPPLCDLYGHRNGYPRPPYVPCS